MSPPDIPPFSPATLVINLENLHHNLDYFRGLLKEDTRIMAMVKADAYGCGATEVSRALNSCGVEDFGAAYTQEGIELRRNGIEGSIMVMNPLPQDFPELVHHRLEPEISNIPMLKKWIRYIHKENLKDYPIHLEVDTGMKRLGFTGSDKIEFSELLSAYPPIQIKSLFTHLASSPIPNQDDFTSSQFIDFSKWSNLVNYHIDKAPVCHALNSAGIIRFPDYQYGMVRLGIGLYGVGLESLPEQQNLKPVQSMYATISQIKPVIRNDTIGYERKGKLSSDGRIAILNIGYADGLPRLAGNGRFSVLIGDTLCPVVGSVCMDMTMVDVSDCLEAKPGTPVEIFGEHHPVVHLAKAAQTIPYEVLTANHQRIRKKIKH